MSPTKNTTQSPELTTANVVLTSVFVSIVMLATIVGNSLVIFCVCYYRRLRGRTNYLIVSLAVADWLVGTLSNPFRLVQTINHGMWPADLNKTGCQFWIWVDMLCSAASILGLMAISIDRLIAIVDPLKYEERMRPAYVYLMIGVTWLFALVSASLSLVKWKGENVIKLTPQCSIMSKEYITFVSIAAFFLPLIVVLVNYGLIFRVAIRHARRLQTDHRSLAINYSCHDHRMDSNHNGNPDDPLASPIAGRKRNSKIKFPKIAFGRGNARKPNRSATLSLIKQLKATKTLAVVVGVFCVCWLPFFIIFLTLQYCRQCFRTPRMSKEDAKILSMIFVSIIPVANSAANPIIYTCFNTEFRRAFKKVLWKVLKVKTPVDNTTTTFTAVASTFHEETASREFIEQV